jgi:uncharacterized protein YbjT (DUF2867 family)
MILIVGGTGSLGQATARRLLARGQSMRIMTRTPEKAVDLKEAGAEVVQGDLLDKTTLARAFNGVDKVLASAHSIFGRGREASKYVDLQGHIDLIDAAKSAGVSRFVYTSAYSLGPEYETIPFFMCKRGVEQYLQASGLTYTILRPTAFFESHAHILIGASILASGKVALFGKGESVRNFVAADDVARFAVMALTGDKLNGRTIDIVGPTNYTNMDVVRLYEKVAGRKAKVTHVPAGVLRVMYRLIRPLHPGLSQIMQFSLYNDLKDRPFDPQPMLDAYPMQLTQLEDWIAEHVETGRAVAALA